MLTVRVLLWKMKEATGKLGIKRKISTADQIIGALAHIQLLDLPATDKIDKRWDINDAKGNVIGYTFDYLSS